MKKRFSIAAAFAAFLYLGTAQVQAQAGLKKADKQYDKWAYVDALDIYEKIDKRGFSAKELHEHIGNSYYFNARYADAEKQYEKLFANFGAEDLASEYYYRYAQTLQHVGKEEEAKQYFSLFADKVGSESQIAKIRKNEVDLKKQIKLNSGRYEALHNLEINSAYADYGSFLHNNQLYFTSARDTGNFAKKVHTWTGDTFTSLYQYTFPTTDEEEGKLKRIKGAVKSKLNESTAIITKDGNTMYFTRNNIVNNTRKYDAEKSTHLKIYKAEMVNGKWDNVVELPFNDDNFSSAHPTLSPDERIMYFASDRPGGYGASDLWQVTISGNTFGVPQNMGPEINTEARETFPFMNSNKELYFSSDGRIGLGGLDVYVAKMNKNEQFEPVQNIGAPINSNADDFGYYIDYQTKHGFFSSNRSGGQGNDDIYSFIETREIKPECIQDLRVFVVDGRNDQPIKDAKITLYDAYFNEKAIASLAGNDGYKFNSDFECETRYRLKIEKDEFVTLEESVVLNNETGVTNKTIKLYPRKIEVKPKDDLFKLLKLNPIYFDLDKHDIRPDAALELAKVVEVLREYPQMKIDVRSHTDSRAGDDYNIKLSQRRAKATAEWITSQGIDGSRVTYKGYGETQIQNGCKNGVDCSEEQHQQNRRSEFIVSEL